MNRYGTAFLVVWAVVGDVCFAEEPVGNTEKVSKAIDAFMVNKEAIATFGTYVEGEHAFLVLNPDVVKREPSVALFEAVISASEAGEWYRYDFTHDRKGEEFPEPSKAWYSDITWKKERYTFVNQEELSRPDLNQPGKLRLPAFDPWTLSLSSYGFFRFGNAGRNDYMRVQVDQHLKKVEELAGGIVRATWVLPPKFMLKFEVDFSEAQGFMPVGTRSWIRRADGDHKDLSEENWPVLNSVVKTRWQQWEGNRWYPTHIVMTNFKGSAKKPISLEPWAFKFRWVPAKQVREDWGRVPDVSGPALAIDIREHAELTAGDND